MKRILSFLIALLLFPVALAEPVQDTVIATVNGETLWASEYTAIESAYLYQYESAGVNLTDPAIYASLQDLAITYAIEQMLVRQDMEAQGCYQFDEATEAWFNDMGKAAYENSLLQVRESMRTETSTEDELEVYALAYAEMLGVTEQTYVDFYRDQYASANYYQWLIRDNPITEEQILADYQARVAQSQALYEQDIPGFEAAMSNGGDVWYKPAGYRSVLQILLPAQGDSEEARLASVQPTLDAINTALAQGESFQTLISLYGADQNFSDPSFIATGYQVHRDSVIWDEVFVNAAFSPEMAAPGCVSKPFVSNLGVHVLYYLADASSGPVEMTDEVHDLIASLLYTARYTEAQKARIDALAATAEIVIH